MSVNVQEAKTRLSQLLAAAERGEEVIIARAGKPVVRLIPIEEPPKRTLGFLEGVIPPIPDSFFDPLPDDELEAWNR